jgi:hypothetical protein
MSFNRSKFNNDRSAIFESKVTDKTLVQRNKLKTQMCKSIMTTGKCPFGEKCNFAHSQSEIRKPICFFGDKCKNKESCGYDHSTMEVPQLPVQEKNVKVETQETPKEEPRKEKVKTQICKFISSGEKCPYNERCTFAHSKEDLGTPIIPIKKEKLEELKIEVTPEDTPTDSFVLNGESDELLKLKQLFEKVEIESDEYLGLLEEMKSFLRNTFNRDNTHYISSNKKNRVKFIAVECDDDEFKELKNVIKECWL